MELEELQTQWNRINERLEKSEQLNAQLLKKVTTQRISSIWNRFIRLAFISTAIVSIALIIMIVLHNVIASRLPVMNVFLFLYILISATIIYEIIVIVFLIRHNPAEQNLTQAYKTVLLYQKWFKIEAISSSILLVFLIPFLVFYRGIHETWFYVYALCWGLFGLGIIIYMYWAYMKSFRHIRESLRELEEFEED